MRRHPDSRFRTPVDEDIPLQQLPADVFRVRHLDRHCAATFPRITRRVDLPTVSIRELDEPSGLACRLRAYSADARFGNDLQPRTRGFERRYRCGAVHEAVGRGSVPSWSRFE